MRRAMAEAEVGDDVLDGDPTVRRLEARVAELLGKEAGLFFPTRHDGEPDGRLRCTPRRAPRSLLDANAHIIHWEMAGAAALCGRAGARRAGRRGSLVMDADDLDAHDPAAVDRTHAPASVVCVENTHNGAGGKVTPLARAASDPRGRRRASLPGAHGRRAPVERAASRRAPRSPTSRSCADTVMLSFSKGLGCPVGAILVGDARDDPARAHGAQATRRRHAPDRASSRPRRCTRSTRTSPVWPRITRTRGVRRRAWTARAVRASCRRTRTS